MFMYDYLFSVNLPRKQRLKKVFKLTVKEQTRNKSQAIPKRKKVSDMQRKIYAREVNQDLRCGVVISLVKLLLIKAHLSLCKWPMTLYRM